MENWTPSELRAAAMRSRRELGEDGIIVYTPIVGEFARAYGALTRIIATAQRDAMIAAGWRPPEDGPEEVTRTDVYEPTKFAREEAYRLERWNKGKIEPDIPRL